MTAIYFDVCCINRPFDDQSQVRVHLETEAVLSIMILALADEWEWVSSTIVDLEIGHMPDRERKAQSNLLNRYAKRYVSVGKMQENRARELIELGFQAVDALHLACAESGNADIFLTTDDRLLRRAKDSANKLKVRVVNPLTWMAEVSKL